MKVKFNKWLLLTGKRFAWILLAWIIFVVLHNLVYALFYNYFQRTGGDEAFFFILANLVLPIYLLACFIYTLVKMIKNKEILKPDFIIKVLISIIFGVIFSYLIILNTFFNPGGFWILSIIFAFISYYIVKYISKSFKN